LLHYLWQWRVSKVSIEIKRMLRIDQSCFHNKSHGLKVLEMHDRRFKFGIL